MGEKKVTKISLSTFLLLISIIAIIIMGIFMYKLSNDKSTEIQKSTELQAQINSSNKTIKELQDKMDKESENVSIEDTPKDTSSNNSLYIIKKINISDEQSLYNFSTKKWVTEIEGAESMYFIAIDNEKNLYIVDRFENILKKLDAKLEKLNVDDTNVDNCVTNANVSKEDNTLVISTEDDFITYIVNLENLSTKLAEINDN